MSTDCEAAPDCSELCSATSILFVAGVLWATSGAADTRPRSPLRTMARLTKGLIVINRRTISAHDGTAQHFFACPDRLFSRAHFCVNFGHMAYPMRALLNGIRPDRDGAIEALTSCV